MAPTCIWPLDPVSYNDLYIYPTSTGRGCVNGAYERQGSITRYHPVGLSRRAEVIVSMHVGVFVALSVLIPLVR